MVNSSAEKYYLHYLNYYLVLYYYLKNIICIIFIIILYYISYYLVLYYIIILKILLSLLLLLSLLFLSADVRSPGEQFQRPPCAHRHQQQTALAVAAAQGHDTTGGARPSLDCAQSALFRAGAGDRTL